MADATLQISDRFPVGTVVGAYPAATVGEPRARTPKAAPHGGASATASATVGADGSLAFTGLTAGVVYVATADVATTDVGATVEDLVGNAWLVTLSNATSGTFTLGVNAQATAAIPFDASSNDVATAVQATTAGAAATVEGDAGGPWTITLAGTEAITANDALLAGETERRYVQFGVGAYAAPDRIPHPYGS